MHAARPAAMESEVVGEPITPAELRQPGWKTIRSRQQALRSTENQSQQASVPASSLQTGRKKPLRRITPVEPLPPNDVKVVLRPRGGLALAKLSLAVLADTIQQHAHVEPNGEDQIRIQAKSNFIIISTPSESRAVKYAEISSLLIGEHRYDVAAHVPAPANTSLGIIFNIPETDTPEEIAHSIINYNPHLKILDVRRLNSSNMAQILFDGPHVPYWVRYRAATYRCRPFRRKTEACTRCWKTGHRQDVCPTHQTVPRCPRCGATNAQETHSCNPRCIVCDGSHLTGSADCPRRYQPKPRTLSYAQAASQSPPPPPESFPPLQAQDRKSASHKPPGNSESQRPLLKSSSGSHPQQVSSSRAPPSSQLQHASPIPSTDTSIADVLRELQTIRAEIKSLREENAALKRENFLLKNQSHSPPPTQQENPTPPPQKRKAASVSHDEPKDQPPQQLEARLGRLEHTLEEQKVEYTNLHQSLLSNQAAMQGTIEAIRAEMHSYLQQIMASINGPVAPVLDITDAPIP